jgi:hypothetical protein
VILKDGGRVEGVGGGCMEAGEGVEREGEKQDKHVEREGEKQDKHVERGLSASSGQQCKQRFGV